MCASFLGGCCTSVLSTTLRTYECRFTRHFQAKCRRCAFPRDVSQGRGPPGLFPRPKKQSRPWPKAVWVGARHAGGWGLGRWGKGRNGKAGVPLSQSTGVLLGSTTSSGRQAWSFCLAPLPGNRWQTRGPVFANPSTGAITVLHATTLGLCGSFSEPKKLLDSLEAFALTVRSSSASFQQTESFSTGDCFYSYAI